MAFFISRITDKLDWDRKVFEETVDKWRADAQSPALEDFLKKRFDYA